MIDHRKTKEDGQGLVEYALIIMLVALATFIALGALGVAVTSWYGPISAAI